MKNKFLVAAFAALLVFACGSNHGADSDGDGAPNVPTGDFVADSGDSCAHYYERFMICPPDIGNGNFNHPSNMDGGNGAVDSGNNTDSSSGNDSGVVVLSDAGSGDDGPVVIVVVDSGSPDASDDAGNDASDSNDSGEVSDAVASNDAGADGNSDQDSGLDGGDSDGSTVADAADDAYESSVDGGVVVDASAPACVYTQGYWKNHLSWGVNGLVLGGQFYSENDCLSLFNLMPNNDASLILAHQLMATLLNGGVNDPNVSTTVSLAQAWLTTNGTTLPYNVSPTSATGQSAVAFGTVLDSYNNGNLGTPHCDN